MEKSVKNVLNIVLYRNNFLIFFFIFLIIYIITMNKNVIIIGILFFIGFLFLYMDLYNRMNIQSQPTEKIIYRYIPRVPYDELQTEIFPTDIFDSMFSQPSPWINTFNDLDARQSKLTNKYFISQI